ncbi:protein Mis18-alpha-like [Lithobates pipiens]
MELPSFTFGNLRPEAEDLTVFMCGKCRLPLGDSSDWDGRVCGDGVFHLKAVSDNVCFENEPVISSYPNETGCVFQILQCKGCMSPVGRIYLSVPRGQDSKIDSFTLNLSAVTMYTFGSARKQVLSPCDAPLTLEKCHIFEDEIKKCKQVLGVLQRKVEALESELHHSPYEEEDNS